MGKENSFKEVQGAFSACHRCSDHVDKGCESNLGCPAGLPVSDMIRLVIDNGEFGTMEAARLALNGNPLGLAGAEACDPCQAAEGCRNMLYLPVQELHQNLIQYFLDHQECFQRKNVAPNGKMVAVIGDGPAAITSALYLAAAGTEVVIYSKDGNLGGLMNVIPRIEGQDTIQRVMAMFDNITIVPLEASSERNFAAEVNGAVVATGLNYEVPTQAGEKPHAGEHAVSFIRRYTREPVSLKGLRVLIVGGGKTANDAAFLAKKLGAEVEVCYRRDIGSMDKYEDLMDEGMTVTPLLAPEMSGLAEGGNNVVTFRRMKLQEGKQGKKRGIKETDELVAKEADAVLWATPGTADTSRWEALRKMGLKVAFAGDVTESPKTVANAVGSGRTAAEFLMAQLDIEPQELIPRPAPDTSVKIAGKKLGTPFIVAAVPTSDAANYEMARRALQTEGCSGLVVKTVTFDDSNVGIPAHYMGTHVVSGRTSGLFNSDNISKAGITASCETVRRLKAEFPDKFIAASIMSPTTEGWGVLAQALKEAGADLVECSFSCPQGNMTDNDDDRGKMLGQNVKASCMAARAMIEAVGSDFPISIKIPTGGSTDFIALAKALEEVGIKFLTCANSIPAFQPSRPEDGTAFHPNYDGFITGVGFTGAAILPASLDSIKRLRAACPKIVILGTGGVYSGDAARQLLLAGANIVEVGSGLETPTGMRLFEDCATILAWFLAHTGLKVHEIMGRGAAGHDFERFVGAREKQVPEHSDDCIGCGICATICNDGMHAAVTRAPETGEYEVDPDKCEGCGNCEEQCPAGAIKMVDR